MKNLKEILIGVILGLFIGIVIMLPVLKFVKVDEGNAVYDEILAERYLFSAGFDMSDYQCEIIRIPAEDECYYAHVYESDGAFIFSETIYE